MFGAMRRNAPTFSSPSSHMARLLERSSDSSLSRFGARRFYAQGAPNTGPPVGPATERAVASSQTQSIPVPNRVKQRTPGPRGGRSAGFYVMIMATALFTVPPISYFYWEHRKAHMKAKKEAMLADIQARVRAQS
ncbi:hypothetical protein AAFC00_005903 [Neodothiora populina]|uniref:Uncharacterized protein n=1 Tax=Neodothiora populina TaxID=2781224 RepID=A0ABR3P6X5_9PEZI